MAGVFTRIATAPSEDVYEELDMTDQIGEVRQSTPRDRDITMENWFGVETRTLKAMKRELRYNFEFIDQATFDVLQRWKHNRTRLRPFPMYGENTIFYHSFQRAIVDIDGVYTIGSQIPAGIEPTFSVPAQISGSGIWTFPQGDGTLVRAENDQPRYHPGPYGMTGIVVDSRTEQHAAPSIQVDGTSDWFAAVGAPTLAVVDHTASVISGLSRTIHVIGAPTEVIRYPAGSGVGTGTSAAAVWVKGVGQITISAYDGTAAANIKTGPTTTLSGRWEQLQVDTIDLSGVPGGNSKEIRLLCITNASFLIGAFSFVDIPYVDSLIYVDTGPDTQLDITSLEYPTIRIPDSTGSVVISTVVPGVNQDLKNSWLIHKDIGGGDRWGIFWKGDTATYSFQKNSTIASYVTTKNAGDDIVISASWDASSVRIYEDGTLRGATGYTVPEATATGFFIGDTETNVSSDNRPISTLRIDDVALSEAEMLIAAQNLSAVEQREWSVMCEGRDFEIGSINTRFVDGNKDKYSGNIVMREKSSNRHSTREIS